MLIKTLKIIGAIALAFVAYLLIGSTVPNVMSKDISVENARKLDEIEYRGEGEGPDRVFLVKSTTDAMNIRLSMIREATDTLDITYHVIRDGACADAFYGELLLAADRGVQVRVLVDGKVDIIESEGPGYLKALSAHPNISCSKYNPVNLFTPWRLHSLLHDKFIIADSRLLLLGGRNIDDCHFDPEEYTGAVVHDLDVLVWQAGESSEEVPSAIVQVEAYMERLWEYEHTAQVQPLNQESSERAMERLYAAAKAFEATNGKYYVHDMAFYKEETVSTRKITLLSNPIETARKEPLIGYALKQLAQKAEHRVIIQTPYATGNELVLETIRAVSDTVPVTMVTNSALSTPNLFAFSNYYFQRHKFLDTGVTIYEVQTTDSIHGKAIVIDGNLSVVGSLNLDDRSLYLDTETMLVIDGAEFAEILTDAISQTKEEALEVGAGNAYTQEPQLRASNSKLTLMAVIYMLMKPFQALL